MQVKLSDLFTSQQRAPETKDPIMYHSSGSSVYDDTSINYQQKHVLDSQKTTKIVIQDFKKQVKQSLNLINTPKSNLYGHTPIISWSQQNFFKQTQRSSTNQVKVNTDTSRGINNQMMQTGFSNVPSTSQRQRIVIDADPLKSAQKVLQDRRIDSADWANLKDGIQEQLIRKSHTIQTYNTQSSVSLNIRKQISMKDRMKTVHDQFYKMHLVFGDSSISLGNHNEGRRDDTTSRYQATARTNTNRVLHKLAASSLKTLPKEDFTNSNKNYNHNNLQALNTDQSDRINTTESPKKFRHQMLSSICMAQIKPIKGGRVKKQEKEKFQNYYDSVSERLDDIKQTRNLNKFELGRMKEFNWQQIKYHPANEKENRSLKEVREMYLRERIIGAQNQMELMISNREKEEIQNKQKVNQLREDKYIEEYRKKTFFLFKNIEQEQENEKSKVQQKLTNEIDDQINDEKLFQGLQQNDQKENREKFKIIRKQMREYLQKHFSLGISLSQAIIHSIFKREPFILPNSEDFFATIKANDIEKVRQYLTKDRYLVYQLDTTLQSPLHWAAKRGFLKIAEILLEYNCDIDSKDQLGRTPLYFAYREGFNDMGKFLLLKKASPWSNKRNSIDQAVYSRASNDKTTIKIAKQIHLMMMMAKFNQKQKIWDDTKYLFEDKMFNKEVKSL